MATKGENQEANPNGIEKWEVTLPVRNNPTTTREGDGESAASPTDTKEEEASGPARDITKLSLTERVERFREWYIDRTFIGTGERKTCSLSTQERDAFESIFQDCVLAHMDETNITRWANGGGLRGIPAVEHPRIRRNIRRRLAELKKL